MKDIEDKLAAFLMGYGILKNRDAEKMAHKIAEMFEKEVLHSERWLLLGSTNEYGYLKRDIGHVCRDVAAAGCIDEICVNDIVRTFLKHGYKVIKL